MSKVIQAEEGDEVGVHAFRLSAQQAVVRLEIDNSAYMDGVDFDWITLSIKDARRLGHALIAAADEADSNTESAAA